MNFFKFLYLSIMGVFLSSTLLAKKLIPADDDVKDPSLISLGPIGVRVKTDHRAERHPRSQSSSAIVEYIFENSLAERKLEIGDVITGVNNVAFENNLTAKLAAEINKSEGGSGLLVLNIERKGKKSKVNLQLERIGSYSESWPYDCKKSANILRNACDWLVDHQQKSGRLEHSESNTFVLSSVGGLAMLAAGPTEYKRPLKKLVDFHIDYLKEHTNSEGQYENGKLELWSLNYAAIFLSEYYLVTKEKKVFSTLEFLNQEIYRRQFHQLSKKAASHMTTIRKRNNYGGDPVPPYWFGHGEINTESRGYLHLGVNVANACVAWELLHEAGVNVDMENLQATYDYIEKACPTGYMGYAANIGQKGKPGDAFGRTGTLGVAVDLGGTNSEYGDKVKDSLNELWPRSMYFSHATCVMGKAWGVLAMARFDSQGFRKMMDECQHDFDLLRLGDGSFVSNPALNNAHGKLDLLNGGNSQKHRWTTAFNALIYALSEQNLRITGYKSK